MDTPISHNKGCRKVARTTPLRRRPRTRVGRPPARAWRRKRGPRPHQPSDRPWFPGAGDRLPRQRREAEWSHESGAGGFSEEAVGLAGTFRAGCKCSVGRPHRGGRWKVGKAVSAGPAAPETAPRQGPDVVVPFCPPPLWAAALAPRRVDSKIGVRVSTKTKLERCIRQTAKIDSGSLRRRLWKAASPPLIGWLQNNSLLRRKQSGCERDRGEERLLGW